MSSFEVNPFREDFGFESLPPFDRQALTQLLTDEVHVDVPLMSKNAWQKLTSFESVGPYVIEGIVAYTCCFTEQSLDMDRISIPPTNTSERQFVEKCRAASHEFLREMVLEDVIIDRLADTRTMIATAIAQMRSATHPDASYMKLYVPYAFMVGSALRESERTTPDEMYATDLAVALFHYNSEHHIEEL